MKWDILILRIAFVGLLVLLGYLLNPFERTQRFGVSAFSDEQTRRILSAALRAVADQGQNKKKMNDFRLSRTLKELSPPRRPGEAPPFSS